MQIERFARVPRRLFGVAILAALLSGAALPAMAQGDTPTPRPTRTPLPSLTPSPGAPPALPTGTPGPTWTLAASSTSTPSGPTATSPLLAASPTPIASPLPTQSLVLPGDAPPFGINLPRGWQYAYQYVPIRTAYDAVMMGVAIYQGPVTNGVGTIIALWGFPSIAPPPSLSELLGATASAGTPTPGPGGLPDDLTRSMLWTDGLRLLQGTVVDITCNVGTSGQRDFTVGEQPAVGTYFNITGCQGEPDTAGWFAGVKSDAGNVLFYAYAEPIEAYNDARGDLQTVLDSVRFAVLPTPTPTPAA